MADLQPYANGTTDLTIRAAPSARSASSRWRRPDRAGPSSVRRRREPRRLPVDRQRARAGLLQFRARRTVEARLRAGAGRDEDRPRARRQALRARHRQFRRHPQRGRGLRSRGHGGGGCGRRPRRRRRRAAAKRKKTRAEIRAEKQAAKAAAEARKRPPRNRAPELKETGMPIRVREVTIANGTMDFCGLQRAAEFRGGRASLTGTHHGRVDGPELARDGAARGQHRRIFAGAHRRHACSRSPMTATRTSGSSSRTSRCRSSIPYSGQFAGYNIAKGKLFTDLHYTIEDRKLSGTAQACASTSSNGARPRRRRAKRRCP